MEYKTGHNFELKHGTAFPGSYRVISSLGFSWYSCKGTTYPYAHIAIHKDDVQKESSSNELPYNHRY